MFDALSERLRAALAALTGGGRLTASDVETALREIRLALLEADVHVSVVRAFTQRVRERAVGSEILERLNAGQQVVKIVHEELTAVLATGDRHLHLHGQPALLVLVGLQGSGKTTTAAKLARFLGRQGRHPGLVAADPYRPAAGEQLAVLGGGIGVPVFGVGATGDVVATVEAAVAEGRRAGCDVLVVDTAGRHQVDEALMAELARLSAALRPAEVLLVVDAMTGQEAVHVAEAFRAAVPLTGLVLTKVDGDARGGAALSIAFVTGLPVKFLGSGEKVDALEVFHPDRLAGRILGMGDVLTLIERAQEVVDARQAARMEERLRRASFTLDDMLEQLQQVQRMGPLGQLVALIPGLGGLAKEVQASVDRGELKRVEAIIRSMTPEERRDPSILNGSRRRRIAAGSGTTISDVNRLVRQFEELQRLIRQLGGRRRGPGGILLGRP